MIALDLSLPGRRGRENPDDMTSRIIDAADERAPRLLLPPGALSHTDREYEYDVETDPPNIEPIEHRIRLDFMRGGPLRRDQLLGDFNFWGYDPDDPTTDPWTGVKQKPTGLEYAEASCAHRIREEERYYHFSDNDANLADAPAFLAERIRIARATDDPELAIEEERDRRETWYRKLIPANLYQVLKNSSFGSLVETESGSIVDGDSRTRENALVGMVLVDDDTSPSDFAREHGLDTTYVCRESELSSGSHDNSPTLEEYGIPFPAPIVLGEYASGGQYPFIPWGDGLTCSCPYKHGKPFHVLCKHELFASIVCGSTDSIFLPLDRGIEVPHRARRFVSPEISISHHSRTDGTN